MFTFLSEKNEKQPGSYGGALWEAGCALKRGPDNLEPFSNWGREMEKAYEAL